MKKGVVFLSAFAATAALSASAFAANICVRIDESQDNLTREERAAAQAILAQAVQSTGNTMSASARSCTEMYVVSHQKTAEGIKIRIAGPGGTREGMCPEIGQLQRTYRRLMTALQPALPMAMARADVPRELAAPKREAADKMFYARIGGSAVPGDGFAGGPDIGLGLRLELDRVGVDASMNLGVTQTGPAMSISGYRGSWLKVSGHYFLAPQADNSPYLGVGLSWGGRTETICNQKFGGTGLQGELTAGWEFLRGSTIRIFVQADATLPMYMARGEAPAQPVYLAKAPLVTSAPEQRYLPTLGLSIGIGWGRPHVIGVEKVK